MEWTHLTCAMAGCFVGSFLVTVWQNERKRRASQRNREWFSAMWEQASSEPIRLADGWWYPKASNPVSPPPPPAPPLKPPPDPPL